MPVYMWGLVGAWCAPPGGIMFKWMRLDRSARFLIVRERVIDRESYTNGEKERKPSHVCAQPAQPCSPAARASLPWPCLCLTLTGWLAAGSSWKSLRQHLRNCDHHGILSEGGGARWEVGGVFPKAETPCRAIFSTISSTAVNCWRHLRPVCAAVCRPKRSTSKMSPTHPIFHSLPALLRRSQLISR